MKKNFLVTVLIFLAGSISVPAMDLSQLPEVGKDYIEIRNGSPLNPADGKIVVEEFFNYICPSCNRFESMFESWIAQLPSYVKVEHVPAAFRPDFVQYARAYCAAEIFNLAGKTHKAVYVAIHQSHLLPAEGDKPDEARIAEFYSHFGVDAHKFLATMQSYNVEIKIRRAMQYLQLCKVPSTPAIVINGRYLVRGESYADMLRIATYLIDKEHAGMQTTRHD